MAFHNPYHFVPSVKESNRRGDLSRESFEKNFVCNVTHDRYISGTYSGRIICRLTAETPFVVGGTQQQDDEKKQPTVVHQYELDGKPAIPASTVRGLISSIAEAASNSALRVLENETYSYRKDANTPLIKIGMLIETKEGFTIYHLDNQIKIKLPKNNLFKTFTIENNQFYYLHRSLQETDPRFLLSESKFQQLNINESQNYKRGFLRKMESLQNQEEFKLLERKHERFIFCELTTSDFSKLDSAQLIEILPNAIEKFEILAKLRKKDESKLPYVPYETRDDNADNNQINIKHGDLVYYRDEDFQGKRKVVEISFSAIWRDLVGQESFHIKLINRTYDFFPQDLLPFNENRQQITLAEQMFGFIEKNELKSDKDKKEISLAGRIYPSAAHFFRIRNEHGEWKNIVAADEIYEHNPENTDEWTLLKILASPKPPSPAMYFKNGYIAKYKLNAKEHQPQGRKFYLHNNSGSRPWETRLSGEKLEKVKNQMMKVNPIKKDSCFYFHIDFENLSQLELGCLLYALSPSSEFYHKIGLGKPIGLGTFKLDLAGLFLVNRDLRYSPKGMFLSRYADVWKAESIELPANYSTEIEAKVNKEFTFVDEIREEFASGIKPEIKNTLELLGNKNTSNSVHYPTSVGKTDEEESFKWFVNNDNNSSKMELSPKRQFLVPLAVSETIPILEENELQPIPQDKQKANRYGWQNDKRRRN